MVPRWVPAKRGNPTPLTKRWRAAPRTLGGGNNCSKGQQSADLCKNDIGTLKTDSENKGMTSPSGSKPASRSAAPLRDAKGRFIRMRDTASISDTAPSANASTASAEPAKDECGNDGMSCSDSDTSPTEEQLSLPRDAAYKRPRGAETESGESGKETAQVPKLNTSKRGRGRPQTTGEYVGRAKALADLKRAKERTLRLDAERELAMDSENLSESSACSIAVSAATRRRTDAATLDEVTDRELTENSQELDGKVQKALEVIGVVAKRSKNLKGTWQRALNVAAENIKKVVTELRSRSVSEEVAKLQEDNARLKATLEALKEEVANWQRPAPATESAEFRRSLLVELGRMMDAKLAGVEDRLLPAPRLRPPLAADRRASRDDVPRMEASTSRRTPAVNKAPLDAAPKNRTKTRPLTVARQVTVTEDPRPDPTHSRQASEGWNVVTRRGAKQKKKDKVSTPSSSSTVQKAKAPRLRPQRSSAVVLTLQPAAAENGVTYAEVLTEAKNRVNLASLGIERLKFRTAATGARILELPGDSGAEKANSLAAKLRETLGEEMVRVHRPEKCAELRILDLDDSVTKEEVVKAAAKVGDCPPDTIKAGEIKRNLRGVGTIWLRCPVLTAKKLTEHGRLLVGWTSARVRLLEPRPLQCFRCLETGHVGAKCTAEVDRSDLCFRCGRPGHRAAHCSADPHCPICETAEKPANHRLGSNDCSSAPPKQRTKRGGRKGKKSERPRAPSRTSRRPARTDEEQMDVVQL